MFRRHRGFEKAQLAQLRRKERPVHSIFPARYAKFARADNSREGRVLPGALPELSKIGG
jgi:hypothetical protein